jgi:hypothetical protein
MELCTIQQRLWAELHQLSAQLPRTHIVEVQPEDEK